MRTEIIVILDRSGSMESIRIDMIGGFNNFVAEQKKVPGEAFLTLVQFDTVNPYEVVYESKPLNEVPNLTLSPRGGTPLLDCIGKTVTLQGERFDKMSVKPEGVVLIIITDGQENASSEWTKDKVKSLLERQQNEWKWVVNYLGSNQDAIREASQIGISAMNSLSYSSNTSGVKGLYASLGSNITRGRSGQGYTGYTANDRANSLVK